MCLLLMPLNIQPSAQWFTRDAGKRANEPTHLVYFIMKINKILQLFQVTM